MSHLRSLRVPSGLAFVSLLSVTSLAQNDGVMAPCWETSLGTNLNLVDESVSPSLALNFAFPFAGGTHTHIQVCDNGYVGLGATGTYPAWQVGVSTFVNFTVPTLAPCYIDLAPGAGSGDVYFNTFPASGGAPARAVVTWQDCYQFNGSTPHTFQLTLVEDGSIQFGYDDDLVANTDPFLIGTTIGGGASPNPVSFAALPFGTAGISNMDDYSPFGTAPPTTGRVVELLPDGIGGFDVAERTDCTAVEEYGTGCGGVSRALYEWHPQTPLIDLSNSSIRFTPNGSAYDVTQGSTPFTPPGPGAVDLNLGDDDEATISLSSPFALHNVATTTLNVASNGHISTASNGAADDFTPHPGDPLGWSNPTITVFRDLVPDAPGSGHVFHEEIGSQCVITWDGVFGYDGQTPGTTPSSFQVAIDRPTGEFELIFGSLDTQSVSTWPGGDGWVVGVFPGAPTTDPGSSDLSAVLAAGPLQTSPFDRDPLQLSKLAPPLANSPVDFTVDNITPTAPLGGILLGLARYDPGIELTSFGMPGCYQYNNQTAVLLFFPNGAASVSVPYVVPNLPGLPFQAQAAVFDRAAGFNPTGVAASNALQVTVQ